MFTPGVHYATTCNGPVNQFDVYRIVDPYGIAYAVSPDGKIEPLERTSKHQWSWGGDEVGGKMIVFAIANYRALDIYQNGQRLVKLDGPQIAIEAPRNAGPIQIKERSWVGIFATFSFFFMLSLFAYTAFVYSRAYLTVCRH